MPRTILATRVAAALLFVGQIASAQVALGQAPLDPAAWGSDHAGKPLPSFTSGDECLFCHRDGGHASGVDSVKQTFAAISLDCFVCHGEVPDKHTTQGSLALLSPQRRESAVVVTSICAQCHLRTGESKSSGLPYPTNFVAGDN